MGICITLNESLLLLNTHRQLLLRVDLAQFRPLGELLSLIETRVLPLTLVRLWFQRGRHTNNIDKVAAQQMCLINQIYTFVRDATIVQ